MNKSENLELYCAALNVLHNLFYQRPSAEFIDEIGNSGMLHAWPRIGQTGGTEEAILLVSRSLKNDSFFDIERDYYRLFIGPGPAQAYPWGSVYTDRDNLVCGATTTDFSSFCKEHGVELKLPNHEPMDHIGILFAVLSALMDKHNHQGATALLEQHLMPWAPRMLALVEERAATGFYKGAAKLADQLLSVLTQEYSVSAKEITLHF